MLKYAVFDLDGTLTDSMYIWRWLSPAYCRRKGLEPREDLIECIDAMSLPEAAAYLIQTYSLAQTVEETCREFEGMLYEEYAQRVQLKKGVREALERFSKAGVKMAVASASEKGPIQAALTRLGVWGLFCCCHTCTEAGAGKESPQVFWLCQKDLGAGSPPEVTVFEDSLYAAVTAQTAGFQVAGVWDPTSADKEAPMRQVCRYYFMTAEEWGSLL